MGSAAGAVLAAQSKNLLIIRPDEPENRYDAHLRQPLRRGTHHAYVGPGPDLSELAYRSILEYGQLEAKSGIKFFGEMGHLYVGEKPQSKDDLMAKIRCNADNLGVTYEILESIDLQKRFPYIAAAHDAVGLYQKDSVRLR